jgi:putative Ca2+/H+ antiporter (TMEM165/GDT1 family)
MRDMLVIFTTVFLAELGDKTQLATLLFASERKMPALLVFLAAAGALVASTAVATVAGEVGGRYLSMIPLKPIAGLGFIAIGAWTVLQHFKCAT